MKKSFRKIILLITLLVFIIPITGCSEKKRLESDRLHRISYTEFIKKRENKESFVLEIMRDDCHNCVELKPKIINILEKYKIDMFYINTNDFSEEEYNSFNKIVNYSGTPTIIFVKDGDEETVASRIVGNISEEKVLAKFKANGIIKD